MTQFLECKRAISNSEELKAECLRMIDRLFANWSNQQNGSSEIWITPSRSCVHFSLGLTKVQITMSQENFELLLSLKIDIPRLPTLPYGRGRNDVLRDPIAFAILTISNWIYELNDNLRDLCKKSLVKSLDSGTFRLLSSKVTAKDIFIHHVVLFFSKLKLVLINEQNGESLECPVDGVLNVNSSYILSDISRQLAQFSRRSYAQVVSSLVKRLFKKFFPKLHWNRGAHKAKSL